MRNNIRYPLPYKQTSKFFLPGKKAILFLLSLSVVITCWGKIPDYDEIPVFISVQGMGSVEVSAVIYKETAYLSVPGVFDFLKIKNTLSPYADSVSGFFITPKATFVIDKKNNRIIYGDKVFDLGNDGLIKTETSLFLRSDYFGKIFGLECTFNFRSLSVMLTTKLELPAIREMRQESMRNSIRRLTGQMKTDTTIRKSFHLFHFGMADWSVISTHDLKGKKNIRMNLALGAVFAGGELNIGLNYDSYSPLSEKQQYYLWRFVNNDNNKLRQVMAGKIYTQSISSIYSSVVGIQLTNTPTTYRRSFGSYLLSDHTQPNWMVELYVNNVLVDYMQADAAGFFSFEVPLVYGNSAVKLRFYGPWGEERTTEQNINIPFNFVPKYKFEYTVSAGMVEDTLHSKFLRANFNYGLGTRLTIGGGMEHLSSVTSGENMPFVNASLRLASNLLFASEYVYGVKMKNVLNYRLPSDLLVEVTHIRYKKGQKAINNTFLEERRAALSFPLRSQKFSLFSRLSVYQIVLPSYKYTTAEALFSGLIFGINLNLTTYALFNNETGTYVYSNVSSTFRLPAKMLFTPQFQYEFNQHKLISIKGELSKSIFRNGFANVFCEKNYKSAFQSIGIGMRYDFSFAQAAFTVRHNNNTTVLTEAARGSILYDRQINYLGANSRTSVGKSGIAIIPYLDLNANGKRDKNEPKASGLRVQVTAGLVKYIRRDTTIIISDLEAYTNYIVRLNTNGFDNIGWQIRDKTLGIATNSNQFIIIEVPVMIIGEVSGKVFLDAGNNIKGLGRILVNFYRADSSLAGQTLTESDGFFSFAGLAQGSYTAVIDPEQLKKINMYSSPASLPFTIKISVEGDMIDGIDFIVKYLSGK